MEPDFEEKQLAFIFFKPGPQIKLFINKNIDLEI